VLIPFERKFGDFEDTLRKQNEEVKEEIKLAGAQAANRERNAAAEHRKNDILFRSLATKEAKEKKLQKDLQKASKYSSLTNAYAHFNVINRIRKRKTT
jgi:hypothetical protein